MLESVRAELGRLVRRFVRVLLVYFAAFVFFTIVPLTKQGVAQAVSPLAGLITDSVSVFVLRWLEAFLLPHGETILVVGPFDAFGAILAVGAFLAALVAFPYGVFEFFHYANSVLRGTESRFLRIASAMAGVCFIGGSLAMLLLFLPWLYSFSYSLAGPIGVSGTVSLAAFLSTTLSLCIYTGLGFQLPTAFYLAAKLGIVSTGWMRGHARLAFGGCFVVAFLVSPGIGGGIVEGAIGSALFGLYGLSYFIVRGVERRKAMRDAVANWAAAG